MYFKILDCINNCFNLALGNNNLSASLDIKTNLIFPAVAVVSLGVIGFKTYKILKITSLKPGIDKTFETVTHKVTNGQVIESEFTCRVYAKGEPWIENYFCGSGNTRAQIRESMLNGVLKKYDFLFPLSKDFEYYPPYVQNGIIDEASYHFSSKCCFYAHHINVYDAGRHIASMDSVPYYCGARCQQSVAKTIQNLPLHKLSLLESFM
jgi:hypothetical protein